MRHTWLAKSVLPLSFLLLSGCVSLWTSNPVRKGDIKEYRYFAVYGGYLPVVRGNRVKEIRGEWLFPNDYPITGGYELPQNPEDAARRIQERTHNERLSAVGKTTLVEGEKIDPGIPQLESLRAVIDFADGRRQDAVANSKDMEHCHYFGLFYPDIAFPHSSGKNQ